MYQSFYGLRELPFELTPNPRFLFLTPQHQEALSNLQYGLSTAKGNTVLIGEAGTGKTTLLHTAFESAACKDVVFVYMNNPALTRAEFVETLSQRFALGEHAAASKAALLSELERVLRERRERGEVTALVIDEAQSLSTELLEEIRLLANVETQTEKLLPLVLAGQPELRDRLNEPNLRQLKQRVTLRCEIAPFTLLETAAYITSRVRVAGGDAARMFTRDAVVLIHERSRGIPRTVSVICDNALVSGFGMNRRPVDREIVLEVVRDFDFQADAGGPAAGQASETERAEVSSAAPDEPPADASEPLDVGEPDNEQQALGGLGRRRFSLFGGR